METTQCKDGSFIDGIRVINPAPWDYNLAGGNGEDLMGIAGVQVTCNKPGGTYQTRTIAGEGGCNSKFGTCTDENTWQPWVYLPETVDPKNTVNVIVGGSAKVGQCCGGVADGNDVGVEGLEVAYKSIPRPIPDDPMTVKPLQDLVTYAATWNNKIDRATPFFASPIYDATGESDEEEISLGFTSEINGEKSFEFANNILFGISDESNASGSIAMVNFDRPLQEQYYQSFSFLTSEEIQIPEGVSDIEGTKILRDIKGKILSGMVDSDLRIVSKRGGVPARFKVKKMTGNEFQITMPEGIRKDGRTVIVFPHWFTKGGLLYPKNVAELAVAVGDTKCDAKITDACFLIKAGIPGVKIGFSFMALSSSLNSANIKHGTFSYPEKTLKGDGINSIKFEDDEHKSDSYPPYQVSGTGGGYRVKFAKPFSDTPAVIVTPIYDATNPASWNYSEGGPSEFPRCAVETITVDSCFVKCSWFSGTAANVYTLTEASFSIVAVGPV